MQGVHSVYLLFFMTTIVLYYDATKHYRRESPDWGCMVFICGIFVIFHDNDMRHLFGTRMIIQMGGGGQGVLEA